MAPLTAAGRQQLAFCNFGDCCRHGIFSVLFSLYVCMRGVHVSCTFLAPAQGKSSSSMVGHVITLIGIATKCPPYMHAGSLRTSAGKLHLQE